MLRLPLTIAAIVSVLFFTYSLGFSTANLAAGRAGSSSVIDWDNYEKAELDRLIRKVENGPCLNEENITFLQGTALITEEEANALFEADMRKCSHIVKAF